MKMLNMYECTALNEQELITVNGGVRPKVFFDVTIAGKASGRIVMELFNDIVPNIGAEVNVNA